MFFNTPLDTVLAARLLTPLVIEHVIPILDSLVGMRVLREIPRYDRVSWAGRQCTPIRTPDDNATFISRSSQRGPNRSRVRVRCPAPQVKKGVER